MGPSIWKAFLLDVHQDSTPHESWQRPEIVSKATEAGFDGFNNSKNYTQQQALNSRNYMKLLKTHYKLNNACL